MTCYGYNLVMKQVRIAELKARLSEHLRAVQRGGSVTVLDRERPIARIVPYGPTPVRIRRPGRDAGRLSDLRLPAPLRRGSDSVSLLLKDREKGR